MKVHKPSDISFTPTPAKPITVYDIASRFRIHAGQTLVIQCETETLAEYSNCTAVEIDKDRPYMQRTVDLVTVIGPQVIVYVGEEV